MRLIRPDGERLRGVFHEALGTSVSVLCWLAAALAGLTAPLAAVRLGDGSALVFVAVAVAASVLAVGVQRRMPAALALSLLGLAGQLVAVAGTAWELVHGVSAVKTHQLRALGIEPTYGVALNLLFSLACSVVFGWAMIRLTRHPRAARLPDAQAEPPA